MAVTQLMNGVCSIVGGIPHSTVSAVWTIISYSFSGYWYFIIPVLLAWVAIEVITRDEHSYNSENGFTPIFNSFVGGGMFFITEKIIDIGLEYTLGKGMDCASLWISSAYLIPFLTTGIILHAIGFWPYWKIPFAKAKIQLY